jgi:hypothetical protein
LSGPKGLDGRRAGKDGRRIDNGYLHVLSLRTS